MQSNEVETLINQLDLEKYVPALVTSLSNKLSAGASSCYRKHFNIGVIEWRVLAMLKVESDISANRICQVIGLDKAAVSRALKQLQASGYVSFVKDEQDGRSSLVRLTHQGAKLHDRVFVVALEREKLLLNEVSEYELAVLVNLLNKLNSNVKRANAYEPDL
jgi:DNA-binding MarR family transcriptional regulator